MPAETELTDLSNCTEVDTIKHYYYYYSEARIIWNALREISNDVLNLNYSLTVTEILLGILCVKKHPAKF